MLDFRNALEVEFSTGAKMSVDSHTQIILDRYADRENISVHKIPDATLENVYLGKVLNTSDIAGKTILEIGAGCSTYTPIFLKHGCKRYYANDLIPERIEAVRVDDPRFIALPGDFRSLQIPEPADIVFASLTMMFLVPMHEEIIAKLATAVKPGGHFVSMDPNYFCPLSIYRRLADRGANPARSFSPFAYAERFRKNGFAIEKLVPFTAKAPNTTGSWALGTTFWLKARKL